MSATNGWVRPRMRGRLPSRPTGPSSRPPSASRSSTSMPIAQPRGVAFLRQAFERLPQAKGMTSDFRDTVADRMVEFLRGTLESTKRARRAPGLLVGGTARGGQSGRSRQTSIKDLREKARNGDRLVHFITGSDVLSLGFMLELPTKEVTEWTRLLRSRTAPQVHSSPRIGRNDPCPCGSRKKYKKCCSP